MNQNLLLMASAALLIATAGAQNIGPSTSTSPYLLPSRSGVTTTSIFTVNDATSTVGGYRMVGIPDGLGAFAGQGNNLTLAMNHELTGTAGIVRPGGFTGSFVSRWEIDRTTLAVTSGRDSVQAASDLLWSSQAPRAISRFCSGDLALPSAYKFGTLGTDERIYMNGEENGAEGTAWAHVLTGPATNKSYELPALGRFSWENSTACPYAQTKTIVVGTDDSTPGQVYVYVGTKTSSGDDVTKAGLTNGVLYGVRVTGTTAETRATPINGAFDLAPLGSQIGVTGAQLETASGAAGVTTFLRPEDSTWDARVGFQNNLYFVTTDTVTASSGRSRLYRLTFSDITNPQLGGTITCLLTGTEGQEMFDNLTIDGSGRILIQEDVGNNARLGRIWLYDTNSGGFGEIAIHDPAYFQTGGAKFLTTDEESSGVIDAESLLGKGWFLLDVQAHYSLGGELVEGGQLLALYVDPKITQPVGVTPYGVSTSGCQGSLAISAQRIPSVGNTLFDIRCNRAPVSAPGALLFTVADLASPISVAGVDVWVDPFAVPFLSPTVTSDANGRCIVPLPVPAGAAIGANLYAQFVWVGPTAPPPCPPFGLSASNAAKLTIQP